MLSFEKSIPRDEAMYRFDKEIMRKIKLKRNVDTFSFSSYLPNGLKGVKDITASRNSLASTAASVLKNIHIKHSRNNE